MAGWDEPLERQRSCWSSLALCLIASTLCRVWARSFRGSQWQNRSAHTSAGRENHYEIHVFTLTLAGERNITQSSTFSFTSQELTMKLCTFAIRSARSASRKPTPLAKLHAGFAKSSIGRHYTKEVWENGDSGGFAPANASVKLLSALTRDFLASTAHSKA